MSTNNNKIDISENINDIKIISVKNEFLKKIYIKKKSTSFLPFLYLILGIIITSISICYIFLKGLSNSNIIPLLIGFSFFSMAFISLKERKNIINKINQNEFFLSKATIEKNSNGECYVTCNSESQKQIKINLPDSLKNDSAVYLAFWDDDKKTQDKPFLLLIGKKYEIDSDIRIK